MKKTFLYLALGGLTLGSFYGCEDLENLCNISDSDLGTGEVFVSSLNHMVDVYKRVDAANKSAQIINGETDTIDGAICQKIGNVLSIDFGPSEVVCADGKLRKGMIEATIVGDYNQPNGEANTKLVDYFVDGTELTGDVIAVNNGPVNNPSFNVSTNQFKVGDVSSVDYNLGAAWGQGFETEEPLDDIFDVSGMVNGEDYQNTIDFSATIKEPLHYVNSCADIIEKGVMEIQLVGDSTVAGFTIDFIEADGCNNLFNATVDCEGSPISFTYPMN